MSIYLAEFIGTCILIVFGAGVVANLSLKNTLAAGNPAWLLITTGWGLGVFVAVFTVGKISGAHLNPAVSVALALAGKFDWNLVPGYALAQTLGAMAGSFLIYQFYHDHFKATDDEGAVKGVFCTGPAIRNIPRNLFSEFFGTFILIFAIFYLAGPTVLIEGKEAQFGLGSLESLPVGLLVWVIGISLGGTTGYAINPARDLGPRIVYALLPRPNKIVDWSYAWVPIVGPLLGAAVATLVFTNL
jgi:glycerol uptake facilitator protein